MSCKFIDNKKTYFVCLKCGKKLTIQEHNEEMYQLIKKVGISQAQVDCDICNSELTLIYK